MLPGTFAGGDVVQLDTYAIVNGVRREVESVSLDRDLASDLPEQVVSGGGVSGGSGSIAWASNEDVQSREPSPWHKPGGWPPSSGDRVKVYVTDGTTSWPRFAGVIDKTSGTVGDGFQSSVIDDRDKLNGSFTHEALLRHHVPYAEDGPFRSIGMSHWYPLVSALRKVGVYNTPPAVPDLALSVPMQGSMWPAGGTLTAAQGLTAGTHAAFHTAPWGYSAGGFSASYIPRTSAAMTDDFQFTFMVGSEHSEDAQFYVYFGENAADRIRVRALAGRSVTAYLHNTAVVSLTAQQMQNATTATLLVKGSAWNLRADTGTQSSGVLARTSPAQMVRIDLSAGAGSRVAGVQVSKPATVSQEFASLAFAPSMHFTPGNLASTMDMMPRLEGRNVADLVDEICKATLTAAWWDESGVFQLVASDRMRAAAPVQTISTLNDITELGWEDSLLSVRSSVEVAWKDPSISKGRQQRKELFRASGDSLASADNVEVIAEPDGDVEWLGVDREVRVLNTSSWGLYNYRRGSFAGYFYSANGETTTETGLTMAVTIEDLGTAGLRINHIAGTYPTDVEANLATSPTSTALWAYLRNQNLPVIRGYGEGKWVDAVHTSAVTGPAYAPALSHYLGHWGHKFFEGGSVAQRIADFIAGMVTTPSPTLSGVGVLYDPRRQLGDVITIVAGILDLSVRALVVGISEDHAPGDHGQTLTIRIISVTSTRKVTYDELAAAWDGNNYAALQTVWAGLTYSDLANNPLEGAPN